MSGKTRLHGRRGQFFSFDVIAGSFIFLIAFFLIAFYWLNAQALFAQQESGDLQRESVRIADYLLSPGVPPADRMPEAQLKTLEGVHLVKDSTNVLDKDLLADFAIIGDPGRSGYAQVKDKLGIPRFDVYVTFESETGAQMASPAGKNPATADPKPREVANEERIVIIPDGSGRPQLGTMSVQVWR